MIRGRARGRCTRKKTARICLGLSNLDRVEKVLEHAHDQKAIVAARFGVDKHNQGRLARRRENLETGSDAGGLEIWGGAEERQASRQHDRNI